MIYGFFCRSFRNNQKMKEVLFIIPSRISFDNIRLY